MFDSDSKKSCSERSLVLDSLAIPHEILHDQHRCHIAVPAEFVEKARYEIWQYESENRPATRHIQRITPVYQNSVPGAIGYVLVIFLVALLAGEAAFDRDWLASGRVDGELIRAGEWWRTITALTLHSGLRHFAGNLGFGVFFGIMAGRVIGPGVTWLTVLVASSLANFINTLLLDSSHRAIGASTAVFAALGLVAGFVWRAKLMAQDRWPYRIGPLVGGFALLAYTGTGDENTDVGAHLAGFICGFFAGTALTLFNRHLSNVTIQRAAGVVALAIVAVAWIAAFRVWA